MALSKSLNDTPTVTTIKITVQEVEKEGVFCMNCVAKSRVDQRQKEVRKWRRQEKNVIERWIDKDTSNKTNTWRKSKGDNERGGGQTKERRERTKNNHKKLWETWVKENKWHPESLLWQVISSRRSKQMEKRERGVFQQSSIWLSLFQNLFHAKEHKTQMREVQQQVKTSNSDPTQQHTQSHDVATGRKTRGVCVCIFVCVPPSNLSLYSMCLSVAWTCLCFCYLFMCVSVWLCETCAVWLVWVFPLGLEFHLFSACLSVV